MSDGEDFEPLTIVGADVGIPNGGRVLLAMRLSGLVPRDWSTSFAAVGTARSGSEAFRTAPDPQLIGNHVEWAVPVGDITSAVAWARNAVAQANDHYVAVKQQQAEVADQLREKNASALAEQETLQEQVNELFPPPSWADVPDGNGSDE